LTDFIRWTVWGRAAVIIYFVAFVLLAGASKTLLLFGVIDLVSAAEDLYGVANGQRAKGRLINAALLFEQPHQSIVATLAIVRCRTIVIFNG